MFNVSKLIFIAKFLKFSKPLSEILLQTTIQSRELSVTPIASVLKIQQWADVEEVKDECRPRESDQER